ncbi:hypothetical protein OIV83_003990 [Microbotryomycetes sp. JL201]|nr:hypothetical protein OIV83_003990 [Microbotryomycetes sp. JL201]
MSARKPRRGSKIYAALDSSDEEYHTAERYRDNQDASDEDQLEHVPRPRRSRRTLYESSNRDKAILIVGIALICCLLAIGCYSLYRYATQQTSKYPSIAKSSPVDAKPVGSTSRVDELGDSDELWTQTAETASSTALPVISSTKTAKPESPSVTSNVDGGFMNTFPGLSKNGVGIGLLPDYQDQTLCEVNDALGVKFSFHGWYAQLPESGEWDGGQMSGPVFDDVVKSGAIFQAAVMPNSKNWNGLTRKDNYQAKAIAKVMKRFTDAGVEVWLRFAHEVNWYQTDGTYSGGPAEFKEAWATLYEAVKHNSKIRMFYCPNVAASLDDYVRYFPDNLDSVHVIGIDYYPRSKQERFIDHVKPFYDKYCQSGKIKFCIGETGIWWEAPISEKFDWMDEMTSSEVTKQMPNFVGVMWFNYDKEQAFKLWKKGSNSDNDLGVQGAHPVRGSTIICWTFKNFSAEFVPLAGVKNVSFRQALRGEIVRLLTFEDSADMEEASAISNWATRFRQFMKVSQGLEVNAHIWKNRDPHHPVSRCRASNISHENKIEALSHERWLVSELKLTGVWQRGHVQKNGLGVGGDDVVLIEGPGIWHYSLLEAQVGDRPTQYEALLCWLPGGEDSSDEEHSNKRNSDEHRGHGISVAGGELSLRLALLRLLIAVVIHVLTETWTWHGMGFDLDLAFETGSTKRSTWSVTGWTSKRAELMVHTSMLSVWSVTTAKHQQKTVVMSLPIVPAHDNKLHAHSFLELRLNAGISVVPQLREAPRFPRDLSIAIMRSCDNDGMIPASVNINATIVSHNDKLMRVSGDIQVLSPAFHSINGLVEMAGFQYTLPLHLVHRDQFYDFNLLNIETDHMKDRILSTTWKVTSHHGANEDFHGWRVEFAA